MVAVVVAVDDGDVVNDQKIVSLPPPVSSSRQIFHQALSLFYMHVCAEIHVRMLSSPSLFYIVFPALLSPLFSSIYVDTALH